MKWRVAAAAVLALTTLSPAPRSTAAPARAPAPAAVPAAKKVFMVSDSVGLGAKTVMPTAFPGDWQVTVTGKPALFVEQLVAQYVQYQPASVFGDSAIVAAGYNYPYWDPGRFDRSIDQMVNALLAKGVKRVFWVTVREVTPAWYPSWNSLSSNYKTLYAKYPALNNQLRRATLRHPQLSLIDWASMADRLGLTYDAIHLNMTGAAQYSKLAAGTVMNAVNRKPAGTTTEFVVAGTAGVPADAQAVSLNITAVLPRTLGFFTVYPCGSPLPTVSNLNFIASQTVASAAIVPIGVDGKVCLYQSADSHVLVDVNGAFGVDSGFIPVTPARAADTRISGVAGANSERVVSLATLPGAPVGQFTAVVNFTVLNGATSGFAWLYTCGTTPSLVPARAIAINKIQNVLMVVETDNARKVCVKLSQTGHFLVDLFGAFPPEADMQAVAPRRLVDTRSTGGVIGARTNRVVQVTGIGDVPAAPVPTGAVLTLTLQQPQAEGWATVHQCGPVPITSVVNVEPNHDQGNAVVIGLDGLGRVCIYPSTHTHATLDVSGWSGTAFTPLTPTRLVDTRIA